MQLITNSKLLQINEPINLKAIRHMYVLQYIRGDVKNMLQHQTAMYSFSLISWLQPMPEYGGCSQ